MPTGDVVPLSPVSTSAGHVEAVLPVSASTSHVPPVLDKDLNLPSQPPRRVIIPTVDAEQPVSSDDPYGLRDYVDLGLDGDGLGTDDFAGNDVGQDPALQNFSSEPGAAPGVHRPLPTWFTDLVAEKLDFLRQKDSQNCPRLYSEHGTFWLPRKCGWFNMLQSETVDAAQLYNPRFFYWDPLYLVRIQCPEKSCTAQLTRHGGIHKHPRRTVDLTGSFWIIGARYSCSQCKNAESGKSTKTFISWDSRIIASLPYALAAEFPSELTRRSGMSKESFALVRGLFSAGLGSKQVSDIIRMLHLWRYDRQQIQYLELLQSTRSARCWTNVLFPAFSSFSDAEGYAVYVPCSRWIQDLFDLFIEKYTPDINQFVSMLSARICAIDHSHKITKHIVMINGVAVFIGLLTVTNEYGEIRVLALVATKAHAQFEHALLQLCISLTTYGHPQPELFYTDNLGDKPFLEKCFSSLLKDVQPVDKFAKLPILSLPPKMVILTKSSPSQIQNALGPIQEMLANTEGNKIEVGIDVKWNVDLTAVPSKQGKPAIVTVVYKTHVYILQVAQFLHAGECPLALKNFLADPNVIKVGRAIKSDLKRLQDATNVHNQFPGAVDVAQVAKTCHVTKNGQTSLAELSALVLHHRMDSYHDLRVSNEWDSKDLSEEQKTCTALDAYASLSIYEKLQAVPIPGNIPEAPHAGFSVSLYQGDGQNQIAHGHWSQVNMQSNPEVENIKVSKDIVAVEITKVLVPGAILDLHKKSLASFGTVPFTVVCKKTQLQTMHVEGSAIEGDSRGANLQNIGQSNMVQGDSESMPDEARQHIQEHWLADAEKTVHPELSELSQHSMVDLENQQIGKAILDELSANSESPIRSWVLKDPWHAFDMIYIPKNHGLRTEFARAVRDAMFIVNEGDKNLVEARLKVEGSSWKEALSIKPKYLWCLVRRTIPPPEQLYELLAGVFKTYGSLKDSGTGLPLFSASAWKSAKNLLKTVQMGYLSDPPGIPLYYTVGVDREVGGLPVWRCCRGTNFVEGGVHHSIHDCFPPSAITARHAVNRLNFFMLKHNLFVGTPNRTGKRWNGHCEIWEYNHLQRITEMTRDLVPDSQMIDGWQNGDMYEPTTEVFGILPIPEVIRTKSAMLPYIQDIEVDIKHIYLASKQETKFAVLNVHTAVERNLFHTLMKENTTIFNRDQQDPDWKEAVKLWNSKYANGKTIFYKVIFFLHNFANSKLIAITSLGSIYYHITGLGKST